MMIAVLCLITFVLAPTADAYKILCLAPTPQISHQQPFLALIEALVNRGHHVFAVNPMEVPGLGKNYTHVDVSLPDKPADSVFVTRWEFIELMRKFTKIPGRQFNSTPFLQFQRRVKEENIDFDVVIGEAYLMPYVCGMGRYLATGKPIVTLSTFGVDVYTEASVGNLPHPSFMPYETPFSNRMSFSERMYNWFIGTYCVDGLRQAIEENARLFFKESYGLDHKSLVDGCWGNASLTMVTSNSVFFYPRTLTPNVVELGPLHIKSPQKLPQVLQEWLDGAEKGVIYMSFGSHVKSSSLPVDARSNFLRLFKELPAGYRVLWKWNSGERIPGQSHNILAQKWLPQQSVLAHPKVKLFITQGGFQSFQEAVHYGVPMVGIPHLGDQGTNVAKMVADRIGVLLMPQDLHSFDKMKSAVETVLHEESYMKNAKRLSAISRDFTPHALDKAVFWVEHVTKHGGASYLRPSTADTTYFQLFALDIFSVTLIISLIVLCLIIFSFKVLLNTLFLSTSSKLKGL